MARSAKAARREQMDPQSPAVTHAGEAPGEPGPLAGQLAATFEALTDGLVIFNAAGDLIQMNHAARTMLALAGSPPDYTLPEQDARRIDVRDEEGRRLKAPEWPISRVLRGEVIGGANAVDLLIRAHDGTTRELSVTGAPVRDARQQIVGAVCVMHDVTERRALERRTHDALSALLAMAQAAVAVPAPAAEQAGDPAEHQTLARMAELARRVIGCPVVAMALLDEDDRLAPISVFGTEADRATAWKQSPAGMPLAQLLAPEIVQRLRAGEVVTLDQPPSSHRAAATATLLAPMRIGERLIGLLALEAGKVAEEAAPADQAVAGAVAQLAALVADRERLVRERARAEATELALREANRRMDVFLGVASHELRTPLTTTKANLQLLERRVNQSSDDGQRVTLNLATVNQLLARASGAVQRQERLVSDLLDVSRIQEGRLELRLVRADLLALVRESLEDARTTHPNRTITATLPQGEAVVLMDPDRIRQVVVNYVDNAVKYSFARQPVAVEVRREGGAVTVRVRDSGPGLPPDELAHVWERFYRAKGVEARSGSGIGLGLGLYISRTIIERHGGSVGAESAPGTGSTFWFTLQLADDARCRRLMTSVS